MKKSTIYLLLSLIGTTSTFAQEEKSSHIEGNFESRSAFYMNDYDAGVKHPSDQFGSNNYFRLDFSTTKLRLGLQYEAYLPATQEINSEYKESDLMFRYATYEDEGLSVTIGDFYETFGSGMIFRSNENRILGLNNSIEGLKVQYKQGNLWEIHAIMGKPRCYMEHCNSQIRGLDVNINLSELLNLNNNILFGASVVSRYQEYTGSLDFVKENVEAYSGRISYIGQKLRLNGEYVYKGDDMVTLYSKLNDGSAILINGEYQDSTSLKTTLTLRRLDYMTFGAMRGYNTSKELNKRLNYLPAITRQYEYSLPSLNPYVTNSSSEIGGMFDLEKNFASGTSLGGQYGTIIRLNVSSYYSLTKKPYNENIETIPEHDFFGFDELLFRDINFEIQKLWSRCQGRFLYTNQNYNPIVVTNANGAWVSNTCVVDLNYKLNEQRSIRGILEHLYTNEDDKNWGAGSFIYSTIGKKEGTWSFSVSDMYNYGGTNLHFFKGGIGYSKKNMYATLEGGRFRKHRTCVDGLSIAVPAYTGINLNLSFTF